MIRFLQIVNYCDMDMNMNKFWMVKSMDDFTEAEWESICLKCGKCCVLKSFEGSWVLFSNRVCDGLDMETGRCTRYETRICNDCLKVDIHLIRNFPELLPEICAYRMLYEGKGLPNYHPLITGNSESVRDAKQTVLDWPNIQSAKDLINDLKALSERYMSDNWSLNKFEEEKIKLINKHPVVFVVKYPIPTKTKKRIR